MKLHVLGCHGGESIHHRLTSFLIDDTIALDTGGLCRSLTIEQQAKIDQVIISHTHLDHIRDLAFLADNVIGMRPSSVEVYCTEMTAKVLSENFFNDLVWPDFTSIKIPKTNLPVLRYCIFEAAQVFEIGPYRVNTFAMNHPVESLSMLFHFKEQGIQKTLAYSSDTGLTRDFWQAVSACPNLKGILCECSFPLELQWLADISGHLSPKTLQQSLAQFPLPNNVPIWLYHFKPSHIEQLRTEIASLQDKRLRMLELGDLLEIN